jgi:hypothetical protein
VICADPVAESVSGRFECFERFDVSVFEQRVDAAGRERHRDVDPCGLRRKFNSNIAGQNDDVGFRD